MTPPLKHLNIRGNSIRHTFGMVRNYSNGNPKPHQGWDIIPQTENEKVVAIADGMIKWTRNYGDYGKQILLKFEFERPKMTCVGLRGAIELDLHESMIERIKIPALGFRNRPDLDKTSHFYVSKLRIFETIYAFYAHLKEIDVKTGKKVKEGDELGTVGRTGNADIPGIPLHLHFEIRYIESPGLGLHGRINPYYVFADTAKNIKIKDLKVSLEGDLALGGCFLDM